MPSCSILKFWNPVKQHSVKTDKGSKTNKKVFWNPVKQHSVKTGIKNGIKNM